MCQPGGTWIPIQTTLFPRLRRSRRSCSIDDQPGEPAAYARRHRVERRRHAGIARQEVERVDPHDDGRVVRVLVHGRGPAGERGGCGMASPVARSAAGGQSVRVRLSVTCPSPIVAVDHTSADPSLSRLWTSCSGAGCQPSIHARLARRRPMPRAPRPTWCTPRRAPSPGRHRLPETGEPVDARGASHAEVALPDMDGQGQRRRVTADLLTA